MRIRFEPNLKHQQDAVRAVVAVFEGAPYARPEERFWSGEVSGNVMKLPPGEWRKNAANVAALNGIDDPACTDEPDFTVEMETGTGKTYTYLRTIFELNRKYGLHKFIIVVPSVAIREGTLTQLRLTKRHFSEMFSTVAEVIEYDSRKLPDVRNFCVSNHLSVMVINKQAFDKDHNIINDPNRDGGNLPEMLRQVRPVIVMDEPQEGMDTGNMQKRLAAFNPLFKLRYSATHRQPKNIVYRLNPYDSYNMGLVKKISVLSIHETNTQSNVAVTFRKINLSAKEPTATVQLNARMAGDFKSRSFKLKRGDDLEEKTRNPVYHRWTVEDIGTTDIYDGDAYIRFTNGETIKEGGRYGTDQATIFREQIRRAVQAHFRHKQRVVPMGIKPLALFFIDRVANYIDSGGLVRRIFEEEYAALFKAQYKADAPNIAAVHGGYFAQSGRGEYTDNARSMATNREIYDKILRDKEVLLSFDEPLEFIFSHSALGVGWDNPNVFTICTLNERESTIRKRQEIGRGLRLAVDQNGRRYYDPEGVREGEEVNHLTVVANQSYYAFANTYQEELREELGAQTKAPPVRDGNRVAIRIKRDRNRFEAKDFQRLWQRIALKTRCTVHFRESELIEKCVERLNSIATDENRLEVTLSYWESIDAEGGIKGRQKGAARAAARGQFTGIDIVGELARNTALSWASTIAVLSRLDDRQKRRLIKNPMQFLAEAAKRIRVVMQHEMVRLVKYETTGESYPLHMLEPEYETRRPTVATPKRGLYDRVIHDSTVERDFAEDIDKQPNVRVFLKLPAAYKIPMPFGGSYNPDFALVIEKADLDSPETAPRYYFTVETKGATEYEKLRPEELLKIRCAVKHFEAIGLIRDANGGYLAPVENLHSFDARARESVGETFFNP
ncbi:MAG: DEAD/DEAH box helicase family protein [Hyphomonadaceae bacterium]|nr:DEAD/DEAH box helicase family protein [Hyphomonadaceae bacterium]